MAAAGADKALLAAIVHALSAAGASLGAEGQEAVTMASEALQVQFELGEDDFAAAAAAPALGEAYSAAVAGAPSVSGNPLFPKYVANLKGRGYFDGAAPATEEWRGKYKAAADRFLQRVEAKAGGAEAASAPAAAAVAPPAAVDQAGADAAKGEGNTHLQAGRLNEAIAAYSRAIELCPAGPSSHVYFANRAAAQLKVENYSAAVEDAQAALALDGQYFKAYNRLGAAYFYQDMHEQAIAAYEKALELAPGNAAATSGIAAARAKLGGGGGSPAPIISEAGGAPGLPAGFPGGMPGGFPGGMPPMGPGGMPDLGAMMSNPAMQQMMSSPQFQQMAASMMSNPAAMQQMASMAAGMFGGGGGGGGMDPAALQAMLGGMGGGPPPPAQE